MSKQSVGNGWMSRMREVVSKKGRDELEDGEKPAVREVVSRKWGGGGGGALSWKTERWERISSD